MLYKKYGQVPSLTGKLKAQWEELEGDSVELRNGDSVELRNGDSVLSESVSELKCLTGCGVDPVAVWVTGHTQGSLMLDAFAAVQSHPKGK
jgi:hypothetical protein